MKPVDETLPTDEADTHTDSYSSELVAEFARAVSEALTKAAELEADFSSIKFEAFLRPQLRDLDSKLSDAEAERDAKNQELRVFASTMQRELSELMNRRQRELKQLPATAKSEFAKRIIPVADDLDAALAAMSDADEDILEGISGVARKMESALNSQGFSKVSPLHEPYDAQFHEALVEVQSKEHPDGTVSEVARCGYVDDSTGNVLRPAQVVVVRNPSLLKETIDKTRETIDKTRDAGRRLKDKLTDNDRDDD